LVRLDVDRPGPEGVGLEDCKRISEQVGRALEEEDLIPGSYVLEISSPGVDRPIVSDDDIRRNTGRRVRVTTTDPVDGRRRFAGVLVGGDEGSLEVRTEGDEVVRIPRDHIEKACQDITF
jgi:ribosome maturation factor RimP